MMKNMKVISLPADVSDDKIRKIWEKVSVQENDKTVHAMMVCAWDNSKNIYIINFFVKVINCYMTFPSSRY